MRASNLAAVAVAAVALTAAGPASAYCRTSSCPNSMTGARCMPETPLDCGIALSWKTPCIGFSVQESASSQVPLALAEEVFQTAFNAWMTADCGGGASPRIQISYAGPVVCADHEYNQMLGNTNAIIFRDDGWPYMGNDSTLALTTATYNLDTGDIYDADIEVNSSSASIVFTTGDTDVQFDLRSIATHEAGHFLGLSHSNEDGDPEDAPTMTRGYDVGKIYLRTLEPDDIAGICAAYPPGEILPADCDATPRHGFASECSVNQEPMEESGCCSVAPGAAASRPGAGGPFSAGSRRGTLALGLGGLLLGAVRLRRRLARPRGAERGMGQCPEAPRRRLP